MDNEYITETIHGERVKSGTIKAKVDGKEVELDVKQLRGRIPPQCLKPSTLRSFGWVVHDLAIFLALLATALHLQGRLDYIPRVVVCYLVYPYLAGLPLTGLWVLAHECGHGAFSTSPAVANSVGWVIHSALMSPYFSWRSSHGRHHQFANNIATDLNYVPPVRDEYRELFRGKIDLDHLVEDAPWVVLARIVFQQLIGWPWYLLTHITAGPQSSPKASKGWWDNSHFMPSSSLFRTNEFWHIVASDVGLVLMGITLYGLGQRYGSWTLIWTYTIPLMWVNHWIVMITYLHHTSPSLPKYTPEAWTYLRGALATVDRNPGFVLRYMLHHIIDLHVIHHLFPRIPHYHAREATEAIKPLLGDYYNVDNGSYFGALWVAFKQCQWVEENPEKTARAVRNSHQTGAPRIPSLPPLSPTIF
ncbi:fatty acid desaturase-domain-containing protein [Xylariales sp. PMI_506]|nr:fatty acid desaturase-domain-containing protein [Xylariales sp. PMI_506]